MAKKQIQREFDSYSDNVDYPEGNPAAKSGQHSLSYHLDPILGYWVPEDGTAGGISLPKWDYVTQTQASTTDTWTFKTGGSGGTTVATVTISYTDNTKNTISTVAKT